MATTKDKTLSNLSTKNKSSLIDAINEISLSSALASKELAQVKDLPQEIAQIKTLSLENQKKIQDMGSNATSLYTGINEEINRMNDRILQVVESSRENKDSDEINSVIDELNSQIVELSEKIESIKNIKTPEDEGGVATYEIYQDGVIRHPEANSIGYYTHAMHSGAIAIGVGTLATLGDFYRTAWREDYINWKTNTIVLAEIDGLSIGDKIEIGINGQQPIVNATISNINRKTVTIEADVPEKMKENGFSSILGIVKKREVSYPLNVYAEGMYSVASGEASHAEGRHTIAGGAFSHSEGFNSTARGEASHAEGYTSKSTGYASHAEGVDSEALGYASHAEGHMTFAEGKASHVEGYAGYTEGEASHAEGDGTYAEGYASHAEGYETYTEGIASHTEGCYSFAERTASHAEGYWTYAEGFASHAEGSEGYARGYASHAEGYWTMSGGFASHAQGSCNKDMAGNPDAFEITSDAFAIGNSINPYAKSNALRIDFSGNTYGMATFNSTGTNYAEYFEWLDGNPDNEDRIGFTVTLEGEKIRYANKDDDYVLGIISTNPSVIGDSYQDDWSERYLLDEWGRKIIEEYEQEIRIQDENNEQVKTVIKGKRFKENPDWDKDQAYVPRKERKEWDTVGLFGKILARTDGTCQINGYAKVADGGLLTNASEPTNIRVINIHDNKIARVFIK